MYQFSQTEMQSAASWLFSAYASFATMMMMIRTMSNDVLPQSVRSYLHSLLNYFMTPIPSSVTIVIDEQSGMSRNEVYDAAETYLRTRISPTTERFKVGKTVRQKSLQLSIEKNEEIVDTFQEIQLRWRFVNVEPNQNSAGYQSEKRYFELSFNKKHRDRVVADYLPHVLAKSKEMREINKVSKLYSTDRPSYEDDEGGGVWGSINLDHPATFDKLAMDPAMKKAVIDDLDRFVRRKDYYKKVGKAWKRGYLLYGPPGTGKSSLIAAMANYLNFDVYDLELTNIYSNADLRRILVSTTNRSIIVIEDIDCSVQMQDREQVNHYRHGSDTKLTLSGLLNFIDGLWSSCGDERIIIFTTNHKEKLDPALLRPGRMDLHIHMSYCTFEGFKLLASNYLGIEGEHDLYEEIKELLGNVEITPAEIAEELMKNEDVDIALSGLVEFINKKKIDAEEAKEKEAKAKLQKMAKEEECGDGLDEENDTNGDGEASFIPPQIQPSHGRFIKMPNYEPKACRRGRGRGRVTGFTFRRRTPR